MRPQQSILATSEVVEGRGRREPRELDECLQIHRSSPEGARQLTDDELVMLVQKKEQSFVVMSSFNAAFSFEWWDLEITFSIDHISVCSCTYASVYHTGDPRALAGGGSGGRLPRGCGAQEVHRATEQEVSKNAIN